jgi:histidinol-phosphate/aromatic aminotransferase/cobyric acid decarboxylase-like protein
VLEGGEGGFGGVVVAEDAEARDALHARASALADEAQRLQETLDQAGAPEVHMIEAHYLLARLQHDREWLTATARRIQARELAWP